MTNVGRQEDNLISYLCRWHKFNSKKMQKIIKKFERYLEKFALRLEKSKIMKSGKGRGKEKFRNRRKKS